MSWRWYAKNNHRQLVIYDDLQDSLAGRLNPDRQSSRNSRRSRHRSNLSCPLMREVDAYTEALFSKVRVEDFVLATHPLRPIRLWINDALGNMDEKFSAMYEADVKGGRPSIAPKKVIRAILLLVLYSVRSERQQMPTNFLGNVQHLQF